MPRSPAFSHVNWINEQFTSAGEDCLFWPFNHFDSDGYALTKVQGKSIRVHRLMCERMHGAKPTPKHQCAHICGNGHIGCVNPRHLVWKTSAENHADTIRHGNTTRGTKSSSFKLNEPSVIAIYEDKNSTIAELARRYGVKSATIWGVKSGKSWSWLTKHTRRALAPKTE